MIEKKIYKIRTIILANFAILNLFYKKCVLSYSKFTWLNYQNWCKIFKNKVINLVQFAYFEGV